ncbi:hypothetical protein PSm6_43420 [Pseudomonas solani]|uniref:Uncharacterized protein n=1 Tax=Pseudomonas solani TaxID=2731552 RepID=A0ABM7LEI6_9PSED|nr:hypothetical protein PSm6_43420 [Pseudomonas solani]
METREHDQAREARVEPLPWLVRGAVLHQDSVLGGGIAPCNARVILPIPAQAAKPAVDERFSFLMAKVRKARF